MKTHILRRWIGHGGARALATALVLACGGAPEDGARTQPDATPPAADSPAARGSGADEVRPPDGGRGSQAADTAESRVGARDPWVDPPVNAAHEAAGAATLIDVRTALHDGYDRVVFDFGDSPLPSYRIAYLEGPATHCGSGEPVPFDGGAVLEIALTPANAHTEQGEATIQDRDRAPGLTALQRLVLTCDFEAHVDWAASVGSRRQVRVLELRSPHRLVMDIRHP